MSISYQQIIDRSFLIANGAGVEPHQSPVIDNKFVAETLLPHALRSAYEIGAGIPNEVNTLKRTYPLTLVSGEVDLPSTIIDSAFDNSNVYITGSENALVSYEPRYLDYIRASTQYNQIAAYTLKGGKFCFRAAGQAAGVSTATVNLVAVGLPDVPSLLTDAIVIGIDTSERVIEILAKMIRGIEA